MRCRRRDEVRSGHPGLHHLGSRAGDTRLRSYLDARPDAANLRAASLGRCLGLCLVPKKSSLVTTRLPLISS